MLNNWICTTKTHLLNCECNTKNVIQFSIVYRMQKCLSTFLFCCMRKYRQNSVDVQTKNKKNQIIILGAIVISIVVVVVILSTSLKTI